MAKRMETHLKFEPTLDFRKFEAYFLFKNLNHIICLLFFRVI
jgi:hypothetical protein